MPYTTEVITKLFEKPLMNLLYEAQQIHRQYFNPNQIQISTLLNIKTGLCPENCAYCPQSAHYSTGIQKEKLWDIESVKTAAQEAKVNGATRFCMGAAWRAPPKKSFDTVIEMIKAVKAMDLETCVTLGMLNDEQAAQLKAAGLDYYNHNLDTSPEYYPHIITTRTYQERLDTLERVRSNDIHVCCGGIIGMGESREDRIELLKQLTNLPKPPESVPINQLIPIQGTPLAHTPPIDPFELVRVIAVARILMPRSSIRLSAGRKDMSDTLHALCFFAGANSIFLGEKLLTAPNPSQDQDQILLKRLGIRPNTNHSEKNTLSINAYNEIDPSSTTQSLTNNNIELLKTLPHLNSVTQANQVRKNTTHFKQQMAKRYVEQMALLKSSGLYRSRLMTDPPQGAMVYHQGKSYITFNQNDYLGLSQHPQVIETLRQGALEEGVGSGGSALLGGYHTAHQALEAALSDFLGKPRVLIFSTGYLANLSTLMTLIQPSDHLLQDRLNHASLLSAGRYHASQRHLFHRYRHLDVKDLERLLSTSPSSTKWVVTDGVFSVDGDIAPLSKLIPLTNHYQSGLIIDDTHGLGVLGKCGKGTLHHCQVSPDAVDIITGSFSLAFGTFGAFVAGNHELIETLIQSAHGYIYSSALPPALTKATLASLQLIQQFDVQRAQLNQRIQYFQTCAHQLGLEILPSTTPIQLILTRDNTKTVQIAQALKDRGLLLGAIRPPTVPKNTARLRVILTIHHTPAHIDYLLCTLKSIVSSVENAHENKLSKFPEN